MLLENWLDKLAIQTGSDKSSLHHDYCRHYQKHFAHLKEKPITLLELGIGGYEFSDRGGAGLKMWSKFFNNGKIYGIDLHDKSGIELPARTKIFKGSQADGDFLQKVMEEIGSPDIIIDDASHMNQLTIQSFKHLFPWLKSGGLYVIEDIESSWWNEHGFDGTPNHKDMQFPSTVNFCRELINCVNVKHCPQSSSDFVGYGGIDAIHFYNNMVVIIKK